MRRSFGIFACPNAYFEHQRIWAGILEDPNVTPPKYMWKLNVDLEEAPNTPEHITFKNSILTKYFSPERAFLSASLTSSQKSVNRKVKLKLYKVILVINDRKSDTEKLYNMEESSMNVQVGFILVGSEEFIKIQSIRLKK
ncbi:1930_t:CDS:2 [Funneliformis caledonium]|uniref:argininosuccinate synthase n=1 Tax=Funneliformis caledonium TaxID=1117310 RepID=A0A9N9CXL5_9GLOM|nr:1930_t:CDS:2 [Funneliformis caledonium]